MRIDQTSLSPAHSQTSQAANQAASQAANTARNALLPAQAAKSDTLKNAAASGAQPDQVSLSDAGRALAQQGKDALDASEKILGDLTRQTLSSLGISSRADALGAKIEFDSLTYRAKSTTSLSASHSLYQDASGVQENASLQFHSEQETEVSGHGRITTADGRVFEFDSQLLVSNSADLRRSESRQGGSASGAQDSAEPDNAQNIAALRGPQAQISKHSPLLSVINDILDQIQAGKDLSALSELLGDGAALQKGKDSLAATTPGGKTSPAAPVSLPANAAQGIAVGEPNPNARARQGIAVGEPNPNARARQGIAVGEPNPNAARGGEILGLKQLQDGAARIARQLEQFTAPQTRQESQLTTAA